MFWSSICYLVAVATGTGTRITDPITVVHDSGDGAVVLMLITVMSLEILPQTHSRTLTSDADAGESSHQTPHHHACHPVPWYARDVELVDHGFARQRASAPYIV